MKWQRDLKKISLTGILVIITAGLLCLLLFLILPAYGTAAETGTGLGAAVGKKVGMFTGSYQGMTEGIAEGKENGLSAEEVISKIAGTMEEANKLEVLSAGIKLSDVHQIGDSYKALYIIKGVAVFTVDMNSVSVAVKEDGDISILLPQPESEIFIDEKQTEKIAEESNIIFNGSSEDGFKAYLNSMSSISEDIREKIANYDSLIEEARSQAMVQTDRIAASVCQNKYTYEISFKTESGGENNE